MACHAVHVSNYQSYRDEVHGMEQKVALRMQELLKVHEYVKVCSKENSESWTESVKFMNGILDSVNQTHKQIMREGVKGLRKTAQQLISIKAEVNLLKQLVKAVGAFQHLPPSSAAGPEQVVDPSMDHRPPTGAI